MQSNRAALAPLRGKRSPEGLEMWVKTFGKGDPQRAERYALAVGTLLGSSSSEGDHFGHLSPNTRKAYAFAATEFFEWIASKYGRIVSPEDVVRKDAEDYVNWLANRPYSLVSEKLKDGDKESELEIFKIVERLGKARLKDIESEVGETIRDKYKLEEKNRRQAFSKFVRTLVTMDVIESQPTMCRLRQDYPQAGINQWVFPIKGKQIALEDLFTYSVISAEPVSRTTIAQRVSALSSLWESFMESDNRGEALLKYNIWTVVKKRINRGLVSHKKQASREQKVPAEEIIKILKNAPGKTLVQLRNKAILYLMVFAGLRTTELLALRRARPDNPKRWKAWFDGSEPPALQILRKGGKLMRIPYPPAALRALIEFQTQLERQAAPPYAQKDDEEAEHYISDSSSSWHYQKLQSPEAPLFPPLIFWGSQKAPDYRTSMNRVSFSQALSGMAKSAGLSPTACKKVHPHAVRHFAANAMVEGGKPIRDVQAILGHSSITTTETYLEDVDEEVRLSGQEAVLDYLQKQGAFEAEPVTQVSKPETIDVVAIELEEPEEVSKEEVQVIQKLEEEAPKHELPISPEYDPPVTAMATDSGVVLESEGQIIGLDDDPSKEEALEDLQSTVKGGRSPGSPDWVYEAFVNPEGRHETVIMNRKDEKDLDWLNQYYPKLPAKVGVGHESFLPWYIKAGGGVSRSGYSKKGNPPFPIFSPDQVNPETSVGIKFLENVEREYSKFVHGDPENGVLPSPLRSVGIVRWYSFFAYHTKKIQEHFSQYFNEAVPSWQPYNAVVAISDFRAHNDEWLLFWLKDNAHTFRASVSAMKRGVKRGGKRDMTDDFLKSSFEGIDLVVDMPQWMIYDDPVRALYEEDPAEWKRMIEWIENVTGQVLDASRDIDREDQLEFAQEEQKMKARNIRDILMSLSKSVDAMVKAKHLRRERVFEYGLQVRQDLISYALVASGEKRLGHTFEAFQNMGTKKFNAVMAEEYERLGVPNPNLKKYRGKEKISKIVTELFPELPVLDDSNIFAGSELFNPKWFQIDKKNKTIDIAEEERVKMVQQFGQDPELLVRRATRAMWEAKEKGYEVLWGVMMSYFSWIVPTGKEMESQVVGIPVADLGDAKLNEEARKNWLKYFLERVKNLAVGKEKRKEEPAWKQALQEMEEAEGKEDALDQAAYDALDFVSSSSIDGYSMDPETRLLMAEETGEFYPNKKRKMLPNGQGTYVFLEGEKPQGWYEVDLFGKNEKRFKPNAPPRLMSPGAVYLSQKRLFAARQLLPSPFRMVSAMEYL